MVASWVDHDGTSTTSPTSDSELTPTARPSSAVPIGSPIATTEPKASSSTTTATTRPVSSPNPASVSLYWKNSSPPISTVRTSPTSCSSTSASYASTSRSASCG